MIEKGSLGSEPFLRMRITYIHKRSLSSWSRNIRRIKIPIISIPDIKTSSDHRLLHHQTILPNTYVEYSLKSLFIRGTYHVFVSSSVGVCAPGKWYD